MVRQNNLRSCLSPACCDLCLFFAHALNASPSLSLSPNMTYIFHTYWRPLITMSTPVHSNTLRRGILVSWKDYGLRNQTDLGSSFDSAPHSVGLGQVTYPFWPSVSLSMPRNNIVRMKSDIVITHQETGWANIGAHPGWISFLFLCPNPCKLQTTSLIALLETGGHHLDFMYGLAA